MAALLRPLTELSQWYTITPLESGRGYLLTGPKGATYGLLRNVGTPSALFPVALYGHNLPARLRGRWYSDAQKGTND